MKLVKLTKGVIVSAASLLLLAGGAAYPVDCGMDSCCAMPEINEDLGIQQGQCGCGCGQFEESRVPDQSALSIAIVDNGPVKTDIDFVIENDNTLFENRDFSDLNQNTNIHSPPLILDNKYTPLLC